MAEGQSQAPGAELAHASPIQVSVRALFLTVKSNQMPRSRCFGGFHLGTHDCHECQGAHSPALSSSQTEQERTAKTSAQVVVTHTLLPSAPILLFRLCERSERHALYLKLYIFLKPGQSICMCVDGERKAMLPLLLTAAGV